MGRKNANIDVDFDKLVKIFNEDGRAAAASFVETEYQSSYPFIQRKLKKESGYYFNKETRKYELKSENQSTFMTLEELYEDNSKPKAYVNQQSLDQDSVDIVTDDFKSLMLNLMKDKMQEINKYIYLEQSTNRIIIKLKKLEANGYKVVIN